MGNVYDRLATLDRFPGLDAMGTVKAEGKQLERLGGIVDRATLKAQHTVDPQRLAAAGVIAEVARLPEAERAKLVAFCERYLAECCWSDEALGVKR